ncbi:16.9 kDa class I heat shock protein 1-like [Salvia miltiorrhiza]|uniref:16.9 kDa class I heat shock protein 1-like n=1 Tax=Salvia miltiorrhiza TaxID=226208 RepID=UPI0025AC6093|nr:16.9 kDa class I heat shock protein 1-like [Salvia miltiorrhiza]
MSSDIGAWHDGGGGSWTSPLFSMPFSSDPWDPWDYYGGGSEDAAALAHWRETDSAHIFRLDLSGARKEDVKVQVEDGNFLHISGKTSVEKDKWHRVERSRGRFRLPENADVEGIKCGLEHGVLTVEMAKKELRAPT